MAAKAAWSQAAVSVIPAQAGIQGNMRRNRIPAFAGMTH
jgi:hypothetical protein